MEYIQVGGLRVAKVLHDFIEREALPGTGVAPDAFWNGLNALVHDLAPRNRGLLDLRDELQGRIDAWHRDARRQALRRGWLRTVPARDRLSAARSPRTSRSAPRTSTPRSPASPARSSWCRSRTRAMRSTPPTPAGAASTTRSTAPTPSRRTAAPSAGAATTRRAASAWWRCAKAFLDEAAPLARGPLRGRAGYAVDERATRRRPAKRRPHGADATRPVRRLSGRRRRSLGGAAAQQRPAHRDPDRPRAPDRAGRSGRRRRRGARVGGLPRSWTCEDSVAAVDAEDKVAVYRNWLGLMNGTLSASFEKGGRHGRAPPQPRPGLHGARRRRR